MKKKKVEQAQSVKVRVSLWKKIKAEANRLDVSALEILDLMWTIYTKYKKEYNQKT